MIVPVSADALDQAGVGLRTAIDCGDFENAQRLLSAYGSEVEKSFRSMRGDARQIAVLASDTKKMFDWARRTLATARTQAVADLDALHLNRAYVEGSRSGVKSWEVEG